MPTWSYVTGSAQAFSASIPIPVSGQPVLAQDVYEPVRVLADRTQFLSASKANISGSNRYPSTSTNYFSGSTYFVGASVFSGSVTQTYLYVTRSICANKAFVYGNDISGSSPAYRYTTTANAKYYFPIDDLIVNGCTLTSLTIAHNNGNAPCTTASFAYSLLGSSAITEVGTMGYNTSTGNQYVTVTGQSIVVDRSQKMYFAWLDVGALTGGSTGGPFNAQIKYYMTTALEPAG